MRFKVTISLYLSPNNRARSLSTLITAIVSKETPHNATPVMCYYCVMTKARVFVNRVHQISNTERLSNKTNQQVSCCQTPIQEFGRRMKGRFFVKGNKDERITKKCCDGEENVDCCERN